MKEIKPKKEKKFLKAMGDIAFTLFRELVFGIGKKVINKVGNKRQGLVIAFALVTGITYASIDSIPYPVTGNKQRLGWQTSGNGLVYRGRSNDTITKPSSYVDKNVKAYLLLDSVRGTIFVWRQTYWDSILVGGGSAFTQPVDSLFFNVNVPTNNVDTAKMRWDSDLATVVLGLNDNVSNELGFKNFWLVKNQTGSTITKGSLVYANGTVGSSGRITVGKFIANGSIDAKYLLGITAHDLTDGEDGYVISFGKIRQVNTDTFAAGAILYPSPTVAGVWTDVEPVAPNIDMPIGFCINSSVNNGTIAIRVASGYKLSELHDVSISSPVEKSSLYYSGGLWRDTTAALLVSDTASMLLPYLRDADTVTLSNRINLKLNIADTSAFARDNQISGTSGQVAYFNSSSSVISDANLRWSSANKSLGINMTTVPSGANLILKNSQEPVRTTVVANQTFGADTTNWTRGAGWTFNGTAAVATAATGALTYTGALTISTSNVYEVTFTISNYTSGILQAAFGTAVYNIPQYNGTFVYLFIINSAIGGFKFNTNTFSGSLDNVSVVEISKAAPILFSGQDDNSTTLYTPLRMPNSTTIAFGGGGAYTTGLSNVFIGSGAGVSNTTGSSNSFFGGSAGNSNTTGINNNFFGVNAGQFNQSGQNNNFFGNEAGRSNISGINNNFFGFNTGLQNTSGFSNNFFGRLAGRNNTTGIYNNAFGEGAGQNLSSGYQNNFFGISAGQNTTTGFSNVMIGANSGVRNKTGYANSFIGGNSGYQVLGNSNIAIGSSLSSLTLSDTLNGSSNIAIGSLTGNNLKGNASFNVLIGNSISAPVNINSNQGVYQNVLFFTGASGTGTTIAAASKAGIKTNAPNRDLEVAGEVRITDLTTDAPTRLVGADADGDLGQVTLGAGLSLASSSLLADTNFLVTRFDTASMLTNYLRSGVAASTYLTQSNAASTYLPLTGGTLTGGLNIKAGNGNQLILNNSGEQFTQLSFLNNNITKSAIWYDNTNSKLVFNSNPNSIFNYNLEVLGTTKLFSTNIKAGNGNQLILNNSGEQFTQLNFTNNDTTKSSIWYDKINNQFVLSGNNLGTTHFILSPTGAANFSSTLGVTGATTLSAPLTVNSSAVFNEGSAIADFRVESDGNANMLFVDGTNNRVGIGYASPTKTLDVNGTLGVFGATNLSNTLTVDGKTILNDSARFEGNILFKKNMGLPIVKISNADYTATTSNHTIIYTTLTADKTLTIPNASDAVGVKFVISIFDIPEGNEALTLVTPGLNLFVRTDGENSSVDIVGGYCTTIQSDGTKWYILSYAPMY